MSARLAALDLTVAPALALILATIVDGMSPERGGRALAAWILLRAYGRRGPRRLGRSVGQRPPLADRPPRLLSACRASYLQARPDDKYAWPVNRRLS